MGLSSSQADKLGRRLRKSDVVDEGDLAKLREYIHGFSAAEQAVADRIRRGVRPHRGLAIANRVLASARSPKLESIADALVSRGPEPPLSLEPTSRIKTTDTTIEKLRREKTRLSTIQDMAGVRVVLDGTRVHQDAVVLGIVEAFPDAEIVDRRERPSHGYRAVHVIVRHGGLLVEVQVRTLHQDSWAQAFERLADQWGRQIRYGDPPDSVEGGLSDLLLQNRLRIIAELHRVAGLIDEFEAAQADLDALGDFWGAAPGGIPDEVAEVVKRGGRSVARTERHLVRILTLLQGLLATD